MNPFILGIFVTIFGICFILTYLKEKYKKHIIIKGKIIDVVKSNSPNHQYYGYIPIIEYKYKDKKYQVKHRISMPKASTKYNVNDIVELRVYESKPNKAIINDRINLLMPIISGMFLIIIGIIICVVWICLR